jgi:hypothetical protein
MPCHYNPGSGHAMKSKRLPSLLYKIAPIHQKKHLLALLNGEFCYLRKSRSLSAARGEHHQHAPVTGHNRSSNPINKLVLIIAQYKTLAGWKFDMIDGKLMVFF